MMNNLHPIRDYIVPGKRAHLVGIGGVSMCPWRRCCGAWASMSRAPT